MKTKEELQAIYFGFYNKLDYPYKGDAKKRWDYNYAKQFVEPESVVDAIRQGFEWNKGERWGNLCADLYFKEKDLPPSEPTLSDIKNQLDRVEVLLNKLIKK